MYLYVKCNCMCKKNLRDTKKYSLPNLALVNVVCIYAEKDKS